MDEKRGEVAYTSRVSVWSPVTSFKMEPCNPIYPPSSLRESWLELNNGGSFYILAAPKIYMGKREKENVEHLGKHKIMGKNSFAAF